LIAANDLGEAAQAAEEAATIHRQAVAGGVDVIAYAAQLVQLSHHLTGAALHRESVIVTQTAMDLLRNFTPPAERQKEYWETFAQASYFWTVRLIAANDLGEAAQAAEETILVHQRAAASGVDANSVVSQLLSLSAQLSSVDLHTEAAQAAQLAASIREG
jgi:hypothetical protein